MPNWCENDLTVEGPQAAVDEFVRFAEGEGPFDFDRFIPYPEQFRRSDEAVAAWHREHAGKPDADGRGGPPAGSTRGATSGQR